MKTVDVYSQYFEAKARFNGVERKGCLVALTGESDAGQITYTASVSFFPHADEEDYAVSYDAFLSQVLYAGKGRRSRKKEAAYMEILRETLDGLAKAEKAKILWDKPLREARFG